MKTNIVLTSKSRVLFGITIRQETKTGFLNLTDLQKAFDQEQLVKKWIYRDINHVINFKDNNQRLYYILSKQGFINCSLEQFTEQVDNKGIMTYLKSLGLYKTSGRGSNRSTSCNPYIWVLIAMEMNPELYAEVITWLTDHLIMNRIGAGDMYVELSRAASKLPNVDYQAIAKAINHIVFGRHEHRIRDTGTESQLKELERIESSLADMIDFGQIITYPQLIFTLRDMWSRKYLNQKYIAE